MATKVALTPNVLTELVPVPVSKAVFFSKKSECTNRRRLGSYEPTAFMHVEHQSVIVIHGYTSIFIAVEWYPFPALSSFGHADIAIIKSISARNST